MESINAFSLELLNEEKKKSTTSEPIGSNKKFLKYLNLFFSIVVNYS